MSNKRSDLNPPLGWMGGACKVVDRIEDKVRNPALSRGLSEKVEHGDKLTNPEASQIYRLEVERGGGIFTQMRITAHAQYRMDQRGVTVGDLRIFFADFSRKLNDWKSQKAPEYARFAQAMQKGQTFEWLDKRLGDLFVAFVVEPRGGVVNIITTYFQGEPDPHAGACGNHPRHDHKQAREVEDMSGYRTLVKSPSPTKSDTGEGHYTERALPHTRSRDIPTPHINGPGPSGSNSEGTVHEDMVRTKGVPGDQSPTPSGPARTTPTRRPGMTATEEAVDRLLERFAGMYAPAYPTSQTRHHDQRGEAKRYDRARYKRNRGDIIRRQKRRYKKFRSDGRFQRDRERRKETPERFETKPSGGAFSIKQRNQEQREKKAGGMPPFFHLPSNGYGFVRDVNPRGDITFEAAGRIHTFDLDRFLDEVVFSDGGLAEFMALLDAHWAFEGDDPGDDDSDIQDAVFDSWFQNRQADFLRERRAPEMSSESQYDRANNHGEWGRTDREHLEDISEYVSPNKGNPGSKVLPSGAGHVEKQSTLMRDIQSGCSPDLVSRSRRLAVHLRKVDAQNTLWLFDVQGSEKPYRVRLQATRAANTKAVASSHVRVSCSCPFWQWQGPEHWAKKGDYLYGKPRGLATQPTNKDPDGHHRACKHVLAVLNFVAQKKWDLPESSSKQASISRVVARYIASVEE